jgi:hypothetical protein
MDYHECCALIANRAEKDMWATLQSEVLARLPHYATNGKAATGAKDNLARQSEAEGWKKCIDSLLRIRLLEDDWDGQGAEAPPAELVDSAMILAVLLRQHHIEPPSVTVQSVQGTVLMEWQWPDHTTLEIDVIEPNLADVFLHVPAQPAQHWQLGETVAA